MEITNLISVYEQINKEKYLYLDSFYNNAATSTDIRVVADNVAAKYAGDFYGLLNRLNINSILFKTIADINKISATQNYNGKLTAIKLPDSDFITSILILFKSKKV